MKKSIFSEQEKLIDTYDEYTLFLKLNELMVTRSVNMYNTMHDEKTFFNEDLNNYINKCIRATEKFGITFKEDGTSDNFTAWYDKWNKVAQEKNEGMTRRFRR